MSTIRNIILFFLIFWLTNVYFMVYLVKPNSDLLLNSKVILIFLLHYIDIMISIVSSLSFHEFYLQKGGRAA